MPPTLTDEVTAARALRELTWAEASRDSGDAVRALLAEAGRASPLLVNTAVYSPRGFAGVRDRAGTGTVSAHSSPSASSSAEPTEGGVGEAVVGVDVIRALRAHRCLRVDEASFSTPYAVASVVASLCCAGVAVLTRELSPLVRLLVDSELLWLADDVTEPGPTDPRVREATSIAVRRQGHRAYGFPAPAHHEAPGVSVLVPADGPGGDSLIAQARAQSWPTVHVHLVGAAPDSGLDEQIAATGSVYLTRMVLGVTYGPHHVEDLVQSLRHSGAPWAQSPQRFGWDAQTGLVLESPGVVIEGSAVQGTAVDQTGRGAGAQGLPGTALWYAEDGADGRLAGPAYLGHGGNAVAMSPGWPSSAGPLVTNVHRDHPAQLAWFDPPPAQSPRAVHASYFARASCGVRS